MIRGCKSPYYSEKDEKLAFSLTATRALRRNGENEILLLDPHRLGYAIRLAGYCPTEEQVTLALFSIEDDKEVILNGGKIDYTKFQSICRGASIPGEPPKHVSNVETEFQEALTILNTTRHSHGCPVTNQSHQVINAELSIDELRDQLCGKYNSEPLSNEEFAALCEHLNLLSGGNKKNKRKGELVSVDLAEVHSKLLNSSMPGGLTEGSLVVRHLRARRGSGEHNVLSNAAHTYANGTTNDMTQKSQNKASKDEKNHPSIVALEKNESVRSFGSSIEKKHSTLSYEKRNDSAPFRSSSIENRGSPSLRLAAKKSNSPRVAFEKNESARSFASSIEKKHSTLSYEKRNDSAHFRSSSVENRGSPSLRLAAKKSNSPRVAFEKNESARSFGSSIEKKHSTLSYEKRNDSAPFRSSSIENRGSPSLRLAAKKSNSPRVAFEKNESARSFASSIEKKHSTLSYEKINDSAHFRSSSVENRGSPSLRLAAKKSNSPRVAFEKNESTPSFASSIEKKHSTISNEKRKDPLPFRSSKKEIESLSFHLSSEKNCLSPVASEINGSPRSFASSIEKKHVSPPSVDKKVYSAILSSEVKVDSPPSLSLLRKEKQSLSVSPKKDMSLVEKHSPSVALEKNESARTFGSMIENKHSTISNEKQVSSFHVQSLISADKKYHAASTSEIRVDSPPALSFSKKQKQSLSVTPKKDMPSIEREHSTFNSSWEKKNCTPSVALEKNESEPSFDSSIEKKHSISYDKRNDSAPFRSSSIENRGSPSLRLAAKKSNSPHVAFEKDESTPSFGSSIEKKHSTISNEKRNAPLPFRSSSIEMDSSVKKNPPVSVCDVSATSCDSTTEKKCIYSTEEKHIASPHSKETGARCCVIA